MVKTIRLKSSCTKATLKQTIAELTNDKIVADKLIYKMMQMTLMTEMDRKHASVRKMDAKWIALENKTKDEEIARVHLVYLPLVHQGLRTKRCTCL